MHPTVNLQGINGTSMNISQLHGGFVNGILSVCGYGMYIAFAYAIVDAQGSNFTIVIYSTNNPTWTGNASIGIYYF